jgi:ABC-type nitrate/sulfonate/bicarbonate transport system substrate-binding protein
MQRIVRAALAAAALIAGAAGATPLDAQPALKPITVGLVSKSMVDWPLYIAQAQGFLTANGLDAQVVYTGSAAGAAQQLVAGSVDIASISTSQTIEAYLGGAPIAIVMARSTSVPYTILGAKGITSVPQLRGKQVIIGGPNDITRIYMDTVLQKAGLKPADVVYTYAGGTAERFAALLSGGVAAAILYPPFSFEAESLGYPVLDQVYKYYPVFPVDDYGVNTERVAAHADAIVAYLKALTQGVRFFENPANRERCIQILVDATNTKPADATRTYDFLQQAKYFSPTGIASTADLQRVVDALVRTGDVKAPVPTIAKWVDFRYMQQANAQLAK